VLLELWAFLATKHVFALFIDRNPKLEDIPNLANELKFISELKPSKIYEEEQCSSSTEGYYNSDLPKPRKLVLKQDLNCLPDSETESEESVNEKTEHSEFENDKTEQSESGKSLSSNVNRLAFQIIYNSRPVLSSLFFGTRSSFKHFGD